MRQEATVVSHNGRLMAEIVRTEACQNCKGCNFGRHERVYIDVGNLKCAEGDRVFVDIDEGSVSRASVVAYGIPVAAFFGGLMLGALVTGKDYIQAICALGGLGAGLVAVRFLDKRMKRGGKYTPRVTLNKE